MHPQVRDIFKVSSITTHTGLNILHFARMYTPLAHVLWLYSALLDYHSFFMSLTVQRIVLLAKDHPNKDNFLERARRFIDKNR